MSSEGLSSVFLALILFILHVFILLSPIFPTTSEAFTGTVGVEFGYDSNPGLRSEAEEGSGFSALSSTLSHGFVPFKHLLLTLGLDAEGRKFFRGDDESLLGTGLELTYIDEEGTFQPSLFLRASQIRSDVIPEDDRDTASIGTVIHYFPTLDTGIEIGISFDWLDFRRPSSLLGSRTMTGAQPPGINNLGHMVGGLGEMAGLKSSSFSRAPMPGPHGKQNMGPQHHGMAGTPMPFHELVEKKASPRDDRFENIHASYQKDLLRIFTVTIFANRERLFSSMKYESFTRYGAGASLLVALPDQLDFIVSGYWKRARYRKSPLGNRTDYLKDISFGLIKSFKKAGVSVNFEHLENDSAFDFEDFTKDIVWLRIGYYF